MILPFDFQSVSVKAIHACSRSAIIFSLCLIAMLAKPVAADERPNVLFIAIDDLNDWLGCLGGHPQAQTPNIDRLAARGVLFTNAHCAAPACNPSRAAVFTGLMPHHTGVWSNDSPRVQQIRTKPILLSNAFAEAGYLTLGTGKLLHGGGESKTAFAEFYSVEQRWSPFTENAVRFTAEELKSKATDRPRHVVQDQQGNAITLPLNGMPSDRNPNSKKAESFDWGPLDVPDAEMGDVQITDWAIKNIQKGFDSPVFLGIGYYRPHIPLWAPQKYFERFSDSPAVLPEINSNDLDDLSAVARNWAIEPITAGRHSTVEKYAQWRAAVEAYLACTTFVDDQVGRLVDALDQSSIGENTVIVLWSDHGWHLGEKQHWGKWTGWERSTRVPLIIVPPKKLADRFAPAGSKCDQPVSLIDLFPTLTELCDIVPPENLDGDSLSPLLREPNRGTPRSVVTMFDPDNVSLRTLDWRYIRYADGSQELYDHRSDPYEWNNLAELSKYSEQKRALNEMLTQRIKQKEKNASQRSDSEHP